MVNKEVNYATESSSILSSKKGKRMIFLVRRRFEMEGGGSQPFAKTTAAGWLPWGKVVLGFVAPLLSVVFLSCE